MVHQEREEKSNCEQQVYAFKCSDELWPTAYEVTKNGETRRYIPEIPTYTMKLEKKIVQLTDDIEKQKLKFGILKAHGIEIVDAVGGGYEIYDTKQREIDRLEFENSRLRRFAKKCVTIENCHFEYCPFEKSCMSDSKIIGDDDCTLYNIMRELGIETD